MGQSLPYRVFLAMSGLPPAATELRTSLVVRFVPTTDISYVQGITEAMVRHYRAFVHDDETGDDLQRPCAYSVHAAADDAVATVDDFRQCVITCSAA